ncbi:GNAT family N-acetyltransferase [Paenibacillus koleovorans]|uniref:GNAT family N-acetyltransferase n=1 Tax=Paenibacillus koleovorans TaxID=121608 RepID=UPI000FD82D20|nr:GNAT family N-acetyltransferase [Paenibacillus koleovorans]
MSPIREMTINDYEQLIELWSRIQGLVLSESDSKENIKLYLTRNLGMSFVTEQDGRITGTILCGHDGRRGYIYHVAVDPESRGQKLGERLVRASLGRLRQEGIEKCHLFVLDDNEIGRRFWHAVGWEKRSGFCVFSRDV